MDQIQSIEERILEHAGVYTLITTASVAELFGRKGPWARRHLQRMVNQRQLHRHVHQRGHVGTLHYYSLSARRLAPASFRRAFRTLCFCRFRQPVRSLLSKEQFTRITGPISEAAASDPVKYAPCFVESGNARGLRLSLIRTAPERCRLQLNAAMIDLQDLVAREAFSIWALLARRELFSVTYLLPGIDRVGELALWLQRHPLVATAGGHSVVIPVAVAAGARL